MTDLNRWRADIHGDLFLGAKRSVTPVTGRRSASARSMDCCSLMQPAHSIDGSALAARLRGHLRHARTRFAPAPTGLLHIGHVVNAVYVWGLATVLGGRVILRVEDHDRQRCRPEFEQALLDDLDWLGFEAHELTTTEYRSASCVGRQSERDAIYRAAIAPLIAQGLVYGCDCTRRQVDGPLYPGTCRIRGLPLTDAVGWRLRINDSDVRFEDGLIDEQIQQPARTHGDILVRDRHGNWTYQLAVTVDDTTQDVSLVVRGQDLLESTGTQVLISRMLGRAHPPHFVHHPLVMKSASQKVSKSDHDSGVADLRAAGWTSAQVIGHAAWLGGLQPQSTATSAADASRLFENGG